MITADNVSKWYRIGSPASAYRTLRDAIGDVPATLRSFRNRRALSGEPETFWALKDLSFRIEAGEVVGVIGRNGAGKSTLLKILSRITEPATGRIAIRGRVGSLLEVGTGFHPELTGRENILLNGAILGMTRREITGKMDEIIAFAEVEKFIDTPVKRYSSGMYLRLAFAVAAHLEPEILIVDEVLAVGDAQFQKKCLGKLGDVAGQGRTVLLVSHNLAAVQNLCTRVLWLERGKLVWDGDAAPAVRQYLADGVEGALEKCWPTLDEAPGDHFARIHRVRVLVQSDEPITCRTPFSFVFEYWNLVEGQQLHLCFELVNQDGLTVFSSYPVIDGRIATSVTTGRHRATCEIPGDLLNDGRYTLNLIAVKDCSRALWKLDSILSFEVLDTPELRGGYFGPWAGATRPLLSWSTHQLSD
jgi:lipopolysaccharide transport system ATP-binding protein